MTAEKENVEHKGRSLLEQIAQSSGDHIDDVIEGLKGERMSDRFEILTDMYQLNDAEVKDVEDYLQLCKELP